MIACSGLSKIILNRPKVQVYTCSISPLYPKKGNALKEVNKRKIIYPVGRLFTDIKII